MTHEQPDEGGQESEPKPIEEVSLQGQVVSKGRRRNDRTPEGQRGYKNSGLVTTFIGWLKRR